MAEVEVEWLHAETVRELQLSITAIRNEIYDGRTMSAMDMLRRLRLRLDLYRRDTKEPSP